MEPKTSNKRRLIASAVAAVGASAAIIVTFALPSASNASANELSVAIRNLLIQQAHDALADAGEKELTPMEQMAANFLSGQQAGQVAAAAAPQTNGRGKTNGKH